MNRIKKAGVFLWLIIFTTAAVGIPLHKHYCGEELFASGLISQACCCGDEEEDTCCSNETSYFAIAEDYVPGAIADFAFYSEYTAFPAEFNWTFTKPAGVTPAVCALPLRPPPAGTPIYLLHHQFTFYG